MPKFKYTRTVSHYTFIPPERISETEYNSIKRLLQSHPDADIGGGPNEEEQESDDRMYLLLVIGIIGFFVGLLTNLSYDSPAETPGWSTLLMIGSVFFILHPILNTGRLQSSVNRSNAEKSKKAFYKELGKMILKSSSYFSFSQEYQRRFGTYVSIINSGR